MWWEEDTYDFLSLRQGSGVESCQEINRAAIHALYVSPALHLLPRKQ